MSTLVLLVTHNTVIKDLIESFFDLKENPVQIVNAHSLAAAIKQLKAKNGIRAVLLDWDTPDSSGLEALLMLLSAAPQIPIILLGEDTDLLQQMSLVEHGAQDYLLKNRLNADTLISMIHSSIARKSREENHFIDRQRAQVTLNSIGDAVLSTDTAWNITFLNPVAEKLTGWTYAEAKGRHLSEVFQVLHGTTRERLTPHLELEVQQGNTIKLPLNCILIRRDGHESPIEDSAAPIHDRSDHLAGMVVVFHDVSAYNAMTERMLHLSEHDLLTSLPNRALIDQRLEQAITLAQQHDRQLAVLFIDLDHFKYINDSVGHSVGDQLLKAVAQRITPCVRNSDTVSRQGGNEFIVLLSPINHTEDASLIAEKIRLAVIAPYFIANYHLHLTASIGISVCPDDGDNAETLIQRADTAMHYAKDRGRNSCRFFKEEMNVSKMDREIIVRDLHHSLVRNEFTLEYQPKINLISGAITGIEALIRWRHPSRGLLNPTGFIPVAEDCGFITQIGMWALREACSQAQTWIKAGLKFGTMAVNISAVEFGSDRFFDDVCGILQTTGLHSRYLELELTETAVMRNVETTSAVLRALSSMGVRIAVDDFGTGYSNLSYLKKFPIDTLKLDKSFVHDIPENTNVATIVRFVIDMAQHLNLHVVAEGIENRQQLKFLQTHDCSEGQGFFFSKPVSSAECRLLLGLEERHWVNKFRSPALLAFK